MTDSAPAALPPHDVFLSGELVDLAVPDERAIHVDGWYRWFNDQVLTRNMEQGMFPNSPGQQLQFLENLRAAKNRIALLIVPKGEDRAVGVCSLSNISFVTRQADFAMVVAERGTGFRSNFWGMEAKCLMTEHAFETVGLERINSYQSITLKEWQRSQILFGYKMEGVLRKAFRKGHQAFDLMVSSCLLEDYLALRQRRGGRLWPGREKIMELLRDLPKTSLEEKLQRVLAETVDEHYRSIRQA